jgi:hypothetical protein
LDELREHNCRVVPLPLDGELGDALGALDSELQRNPPTSLAKAKQTWLPYAQSLATAISSEFEKSGISTDWNLIPDHFGQVLVATERIVPIDLMPCRETLLGTECITSHSPLDEKKDVSANLLKALGRQKLPLRRIAHVCSYYPRTTSLHEMDVISATLSLDNKLAIEHYFYPSTDVASSLFRRSDLDILHFECHGTPTKLQIDNPDGDPLDIRGLYNLEGPSVYFFLGCEAGRDTESVAPSFVKKGARASIGSYCRFFSGGDSGEVRTSTFYDELYRGLVEGRSLGESSKAGRKASAPERVYYCGWLLFGNPNLSFVPVRFGRGQSVSRT